MSQALCGAARPPTSIVELSEHFLLKSVTLVKRDATIADRRIVAGALAWRCAHHGAPAPHAEHRRVDVAVTEQLLVLLATGKYRGTCIARCAHHPAVRKRGHGINTESCTCACWHGACGCAYRCSRGRCATQNAGIRRQRERRRAQRRQHMTALEMSVLMCKQQMDEVEKVEEMSHYCGINSSSTTTAPTCSSSA